MEPLFGKDDISLISFDKVSKNISNKDNYLAITCDMLVEHTDVPPKMTFKQIARKSLVSCISDLGIKRNKTCYCFNFSRNTSIP